MGCVGCCTNLELLSLPPKHAAGASGQHLTEHNCASWLPRDGGGSPPCILLLSPLCTEAVASAAAPTVTAATSSISLVLRRCWKCKASQLQSSSLRHNLAQCWFYELCVGLTALAAQLQMLRALRGRTVGGTGSAVCCCSVLTHLHSKGRNGVCFCWYHRIVGVGRDS